MPLSDTTIRNASICPKNYSLADMEGLSLFVSKTGTKSGYFRYRDGRQTSQTQMKRIFNNDVLPWIGDLGIHDITRQDVLKVLRRIERRQAWSVATKCRSWLNQLFRYAMVEYDLPINPAADLDIVAVTPPPPHHQPFLQLTELPAFLRRLNECNIRLRTRLSVKLLLLTGVRTGEMRFTTPEQFDLKKGSGQFLPAGAVLTARFAPAATVD